MTPAEHYARAEQLLDELSEWSTDALQNSAILAEAQAHATLATYQPAAPSIVKLPGDVTPAEIASIRERLDPATRDRVVFIAGGGS